MNRFVSEDHMLQEIEMISAAVRRCVDNGRMDWWHSCAMRRFAVRNMDDLSYYYYVPTRDAQRVKIRRVITDFSKRTRSDDDDDDDNANEDDFLFSSSSLPVRVLDEYYFKASSSSSVDAASASAQSVLNPSSIRNRLMQNDDLVSVWTNLWQDALEPPKYRRFKRKRISRDDRRTTRSKRQLSVRSSRARRASGQRGRVFTRFLR